MTEDQYAEAMLATVQKPKLKDERHGGPDVEHIAALKVMQPGRYYTAADMLNRMQTDHTERKVSIIMRSLCTWELTSSNQLERVTIWTLTPRGEKYAEMLR